MKNKLKIISIINIIFLLATTLYANDDCYDLIPRIKIYKDNKYHYSESLSKSILNDINKTKCMTQNDLNKYHENTLKYFIEKEGYYIPPIVKVEYPEEKSLYYADFLVEFQQINNVLFEGKAENRFFKYLTHLSKNDNFLTSKILNDQRFFNSLGYLRLDAFDINQTTDGKFDAIYTINQDNNWTISISLTNSQSEVYNSFGDLSSYFSFDLYNPLGLAWHYNLSGSSSILHSEATSYSEFYSASVNIPFKSLKFIINMIASNNVVESSNVNYNVVSQSFYQGKQTKQSYKLLYNTPVNDEISLGTSFNMDFNQNQDYSFINAQGEAGIPTEDNNDYSLFTFALNGSYSNPKIYLNSEIKYSKLIESLSTIKSQEIYYNPGTYYQNNYSFLNYNISAYIPLSKWGNYSLNIEGQSTNEILRDSHKFGAGDRNTVRGYGNNYHISSENGYVIRNDLNIPINDKLNTYIAYDYASLSPTVKNLFGYDTANFSGAAVGIKGQLFDISYDLFLGKPIANTLSNFKNEYSIGYSLNYSF